MQLYFKLLFNIALLISLFLLFFQLQNSFSTLNINNHIKQLPIQHIGSSRILQSIANSETLNVNHQLQNPCQCLNQGQCNPHQLTQLSLDNLQQKHCNCPRSFIGRKCEQQAQQFMNNRQIFKFINIYQYKFFYYEPKQQNMFSFNFHLCFDSKTYLKPEVQLQSFVTFFLNIEDQNGNLELTQDENNPTTVELNRDQCKFITVDYTMFETTKLQTIQKFVFAIKLGNKLNNTVMQKLQQNQQKPPQKLKKTDRGLKFNITTITNEKNLSYSNWTNKRNVTEGRKKPFNPSAFRRIYLSFVIDSFAIDDLISTILYSLITLAAFIIIAVMIFFLRTRILGVRIIESLNHNTGLINDLKHFEVYLPKQVYIRPSNNIIDHGQSDNDLECSICLACFENNDIIRKTPCDHVFHLSCIDSWCIQHLSCPVCRRSLTEIKIKDFFNASMQQLGTNSDSND